MPNGPIIQLIRALGLLNYRSIDVVEIAPPCVHADTSHAAAVIAFELLGQVAAGRARGGGSPC